MDDEDQPTSKKSKKGADAIKVTDKMVEDWKAAMKKEPTLRVFREVTKAFKAAVATTKGEGGSQCKYKVADSSGRISCVMSLSLKCIHLKDLH